MLGAAQGDKDTSSTYSPCAASTVCATDSLWGLRYIRGGAFVPNHGGYRGGCDHQEPAYTPQRMRKTHGFNWRVRACALGTGVTPRSADPLPSQPCVQVFVRVRQRQIMLVGGIFLALIARSSLVNSTREGGAASADGQQFLLHRDQVELRHGGAQVDSAASPKLHAKPSLASQHNVVPEVEATHEEHEEDRHLHAEDEDMADGLDVDHDQDFEDAWKADEEHFDEMDGMDWGDHWEEMHGEDGDTWAEDVQHRADEHRDHTEEHDHEHAQEQEQEAHTPQPTDVSRSEIGRAHV